MRFLNGKKGVSAVIATVLLLVITIALVGTAYLYFQSTLTGSTQDITATDNFCDAYGDVSVTIKNLGTNPITSVGCTLLNATSGLSSCNTTNALGLNAINTSNALQPGSAQTFSNFGNCTGSGARYCTYRLTPSAGRVETVQIACS